MANESSAIRSHAGQTGFTEKGRRMPKIKGNLGLNFFLFFVNAHRRKRATGDETVRIPAVGSAVQPAIVVSKGGDSAARMPRRLHSIAAGDYQGDAIVLLMTTELPSM
jgi:hypothetical protein